MTLTIAFLLGLFIGVIGGVLLLSAIDKWLDRELMSMLGGNE